MENWTIRTNESGARDKEGTVNPAQVVELGAEALSVVRNVLAMRFRFLDRALWKMEMVPTPLVNLVGTDTRKLYYNPTDVLRRFAAGRDELTRDMLHAIFHCLFYHPFIRNDVDQGLWDLSCDIVAEQACLELAGKSFPSKGDTDRARVVGQLETSLGNLSAEKLYMHFETNDVPIDELFELDALFVRDEHGLWYTTRDGESSRPADDPAQPEESAAARLKSQSGSQGGESPDEAEPSEDGEDAGEGEAEEPREPAADQAQDASDQQPQPTGPDDQSRDEWEHIAQRVKVEVRNASNRYGKEAGALSMRLSVASSKRYDYRSFLMRFAELHEEMRLNPDEFDLIYYSFGMDLYGNVPLVEPLEYTDSTKVRTFVVAIDTSGSVQGELVKRFLEETYSILEESTSFFDERQVRIIQCDARVQSDVVVTNREELDAYLRDFELLGMGGTDFRPVFEHVDELARAGELDGLRGLIYFTDGRGTYPAHPPDYETVFVFVKDEYDAPPVPPWAYKLVLDEFHLRFLGRGEGDDESSPQRH